MIRTTVTVLVLALSSLLPAQQRGQGGRPARPDLARPDFAPRAERGMAPESEKAPGAANRDVGGELARLRQRLEQLRAQIDRLEHKRGGPGRDAGPQQGDRPRGPGFGAGAGPGARGMARGGGRQGPMRGMILERLRERFQAMRGQGGRMQGGRGQDVRGQGMRGPRKGAVDARGGAQRAANGHRGPQRQGGRGLGQGDSGQRGPGGARGPRGPRQGREDAV